MHRAVDCRLGHAERPDDRAGYAVEQVDRPAKCPKEPGKRAGDEQRDAFGACEADGLWDEFADYNVKRAKHRERKPQRDSVRDQRSASRGRAREQWLQQAASVLSPSAPSAKLVSVMPS